MGFINAFSNKNDHDENHDDDDDDDDDDSDDYIIVVEYLVCTCLLCILLDVPV